MIGIMLLSADGFYADDKGSVEWGPKSDKIWLKKFIKHKTMLVGYNTWKTIKDFDKLVKDSTWVFEPEEFVDINFGGIKTWLANPPEKFIVHKAFVRLGTGLALPRDFFKDYEFQSHEWFPEYEELIYVKK